MGAGKEFLPQTADEVAQTFRGVFQTANRWIAEGSYYTLLITAGQRRCRIASRKPSSGTALWRPGSGGPKTRPSTRKVRAAFQRGLGEIAAGKTNAYHVNFETVLPLSNRPKQQILR